MVVVLVNLDISTQAEHVFKRLIQSHETLNQNVCLLIKSSNVSHVKSHLQPPES